MIGTTTDSTLLFVYGSLLPHVPNSRHDLLLPARFIAPATIPGVLFDLGGYPGAQWIHNAPTQVHGELFELLSPTLSLPNIDRYEGYHEAHPEGCEFLRILRTVRDTSGTQHHAWVYEYQLSTDGVRIIEGGDYRWAVKNRDQQKGRPRGSP